MDQSKSVRGQLLHRFASGLVFEGYADWQDRPDSRDVSTLEAFVGWQEKSWRRRSSTAARSAERPGPAAPTSSSSSSRRSPPSR